jgi:hypothetical protein
MSNAPGITVRVPLTVRRRGGRKLVITPDGGSATVRRLRARGPIRRW